MTTVEQPLRAEDRLSRRTILVGAGLAATATAAGVLTPRRHDAGTDAVKLEDVIPQIVGSWRRGAAGAFILPQDDAATRAYDQVITRRFSAPSKPDIMLLIARCAAQSGLMRVHRPDVCYTNAGFAIHNLHGLNLTIEADRVIAAESFVGVREDRVETVLYWTRIAKFFPSTMMAQRLAMLKLGLSGLVPDGVLVRISAQGAGDVGTALKTFARALVRQSDPQGRTLLLGPQDGRS